MIYLGTEYGPNLGYVINYLQVSCSYNFIQLYFSIASENDFVHHIHSARSICLSRCSAVDDFKMFDIKVAVTYYIQELFIKKKKSKYIVSFMLTCNQGLQIPYKIQVHLDYLTCTVTFYRFNL